MHGIICHLLASRQKPTKIFATILGYINAWSHVSAAIKAVLVGLFSHRQNVSRCAAALVNILINSSGSQIEL